LVPASRFELLTPRV